MNERLQKIVEESGMTQYVAANNKYLERLADLVVIEALQHLTNMGHDSSRELLEKYFGIK